MEGGGLPWNPRWKEARGALWDPEWSEEVFRGPCMEGGRKIRGTIDGGREEVLLGNLNGGRDEVFHGTMGGGREVVSMGP